MKPCDQSESAEGGEVVAIGSTDLSDDTVHSEAAERPGDLCGGPAEEGSQLLAAESVYQKFSAHEAEDQAEIVVSEEVESAVGASVLAHSIGELVQVSVSVGRVFEGGEKFQVSAICGEKDLADGRQAVDRTS